jgi:ectoine hydroxylase-related dioxygenase (phytanoyl-CoA dioxygenase family)
MEESMQPSQLTGILWDSQLRQYDADGFLVLPAHLDAPMVSSLARAADELLARVGPWVRENPRLQVDQMGEATGIRQAWPVVDLSETLANLAADERIVGLFRSLFGGDTPVLFEDKLNYKHPRVGTHFPMHQDFSYWHPYSSRLVSALIYIDAATEENGCLEVVAGRHKSGLLERTEMAVGAGKDHYVPAEVVDPALAVKVPGPPGTVILFSCLTPHTSAPNRSDNSRRALILTYNPAQDGDFYEETSGANREKSRAWSAALPAP